MTTQHLIDTMSTEDDAKVDALLAELEAAKHTNEGLCANLAVILEGQEAVNQRFADMHEALRALTSAMVWASGSGDFAVEGVAHEGWEKLARPALNRAMDLLKKGAEPRPVLLPDENAAGHVYIAVRPDGVPAAVDMTAAGAQAKADLLQLRFVPHPYVMVVPMREADGD